MYGYTIYVFHTQSAGYVKIILIIAVIYCRSLTFETVRRNCEISKVGLRFLNISMVGLVSIPRLHSVINVSFSRCFNNGTNTLVTTD